MKPYGFLVLGIVLGAALLSILGLDAPNRTSFAVHNNIYDQMDGMDSVRSDTLQIASLGGTRGFGFTNANYLYILDASVDTKIVPLGAGLPSGAAADTFLVKSGRTLPVMKFADFDSFTAIVPGAAAGVLSFMVGDE